MSTELEDLFQTYFNEIVRCMSAKCYWAALHILVILPDVCAALEADDGKASDGRYRNWCKRYFGKDPTFTASDRYALRCVLLHQGKTVTDEGQYGSYSFVQPDAYGGYLHRLVQDFGDGIRPNCSLDIGQMAIETETAVRAWFADLIGASDPSRLQNVRGHGRWLVRSGRKEIASVTGVIISAPVMGSTGGYNPTS